MKKIVLALVSLLVITAPSFALGPVPITLYGGSQAGMGTGSIIGANVMLSLPFLPSVGIECDTVNGAVHAPSAVNFTVSRIGLVYKMNLLLLGLNISAGTVNLNTSGPIDIGGITISGNQSGSYIGIGPEIELMGFVINPKATYNTFTAGSLPEVDITVGYRF